MAARARAAALDSALKRAGTDVFKPQMQEPLISLLSQAYGKPVELNITKLAKPHLDAGILASIVTQRLSDRRNTPRTAVRSAITNVPLPTRSEVPSSADHAALAIRALKRRPSLRSVGMQRTSVANVIDELKLKQVTSLFVETAGRLSKRMTANRSGRKRARRGLTSKGPGFMVRGVHPLHLQTALRAGKRRVGAYGVRIKVGHH